MVGTVSDITDRSEVHNAPKRSRRVSTVLGVFAVAVVLLLGGFAFFLSTIQQYKEPDPSVRADGIAVLTGGVARLDPAVGLLRNKRGSKLLISGVNETITGDTLRNILGIDAALFDCCVDLDHKALDTIGNAIMTERWVRENGFGSVLVVTNDYHMPRSLLEINRRLPDHSVIAFPVSNPVNRDETFSQMLNRYRVLFGEYGKYLLAVVRGPFSSISGVQSASLSSGW